MSGVSASTLIIFIATILVAAGVAGTLVTTVSDIANSAETQGNEITNSINANIELLNDGGGDKFYTETTADPAAQITVFVRNVGATPLIKEPSEVDVLVNGLFIDSSALEITSVDGDDGQRAWVEGEVIRVDIELADELTGSRNRLTVAASGAERSLEFNANTEDSG